MRGNKMFLIGTILSWFSVFALHAQQSTMASGGNATGTGGFVSYSVGQVLFKTYAGSNVAISEGVQQPFEISVLSIETPNKSNANINVFPNPANDMISLNVENYDAGLLTYQLIDESGRILENKNLSGNLTPILMLNYSAGIYFLKVSEANNVVKTFKIIKN